MRLARLSLRAWFSALWLLMLREAIGQRSASAGFLLGLVFGSVVSSVTCFALLAQPQKLAQALQITECLQSSDPLPSVPPYTLD